MKRIFLFLFLFVFLATCLVAAQHQHAAPKGVKQAPVAMYAGLGGIHHPVSTKSAQAQKYFDQGLALLFGFNHDEAAKAFTQATKFDPELATGASRWSMA